MPDETLRPPPPVRPSLSRPAVEFPERPRFDGSLTLGSEPSGTERRHILSPDESAAMTGLGYKKAIGHGVPSALVKQLANQGLIVLSVMEGGWTVEATQLGRETIQRGWYPLAPNDDVG